MRKELECSVGLYFRLGDRIAATHPRQVNGRTAEGVASSERERVPVGDGEAEMIAKRLTEYDFVGLVPVVSERILGCGTLVLNR